MVCNLIDTIFKMHLVILSHRQEAKWLPSRFKKKKKVLQEEGYFVASPENESPDESRSNITEPQNDSKHNNLVGLKTTQ